MPHPVRASLALGVIFAVASAFAHAQGFPAKPIRIIVPTGPGGGFDFQARTIAAKLTERGTNVIVENRPGAGSLTGTEAAARASADGYTLLYGGLTNMAVNVGLYPKLSYDPLADFRLLAMSVSVPFCLVARKDLPQTSLKEVVDYARANPGKLNYASAGLGTGQHVAAAAMFHLANVDVVHVPYKSAAPAMQDVIANRMDFFFDNCGVAKPHIDAGSVRLLAVSTRERSAAFPYTPSVTETGVAPLEMDSWTAIFAPSATPEPVIEWLRKELAATLAEADLNQRLERGGGRVIRTPIPAAEAFLRAEVEKWRALVPKAGVTAQ